MKKSWFFLILMAGLLFLGQGALAEEPKKDTFYVSVSAMEDGGSMPADAVMMQRVNGKYYLFLPGNVKLKDARVWFSGGGTVTLGGKTLHSGDKTSALAAGKAVKLKFMNKDYTLNVMQGSPVAALFINTATGSMAKVDKSKTYKEEGSLRLINTKGLFDYDGALEYIKLRGNTSATFSKKSYTIKLNQKKDLLGMGKAKKWVITGNSRDHSLLRNQIVFAMADYVGLPYTSKCRQVELYLNHVYNGTYILQEKVEIGKNRVDITDLEKATQLVNSKPLESYKSAGARKVARNKFKYIDIPVNPEDITGGYLVEYEDWQLRYKDEPCVYTTAKGKLIMVKEPEYASKEQMEYISAFMQGFENAIFSQTGIDPKSGKRYDEFVDFESLVLKYMLEEVSKNSDGNKSSQYYYKPIDSESTVAFAGPAWDYDTTFGVYGRKRERKTLLSPTGFCQNEISGTKVWWPQLYAKEDFYNGICKMWKERYSHAMRILVGKEKDEKGRILSVKEYAAAIEKSAAMNFTLWPIKQSSENYAQCGKTFKSNVEYLEKFIQQRYTFLEGEWGK